MLLKIQYFGYLMQRTDSLEKSLMLREIESGRRGERQRMRWLDCITHSMDMNLSRLRELVRDRAVVHGVAKSLTKQLNWTELLSSGFSWRLSTSWMWKHIRKMQSMLPSYKGILFQLFPIPHEDRGCDNGLCSLEILVSLHFFVCLFVCLDCAPISQSSALYLHLILSTTNVLAPSMVSSMVSVSLSLSLICIWGCTGCQC